MIDEHLIVDALRPFTAVSQAGDGLLVATHCLYPGGDGVSVKVMLQRNGFVVSDDGSGWAALLAAGLDMRLGYIRRAQVIAGEFGLRFVEGVILVDEVDQGQLGAAVVGVANASQRWVHETLQEQNRRIERDLSRLIRDHLRRLFPTAQVQEDLAVVGDSTKVHHVAQAVKIDERLLLVEPVTNQSGAIAAAFLKFSDIGKAHPDWPREAVIEDKARWKAEDVNLLSEASTGVIDIDTALEPIGRRYAA